MVGTPIKVGVSYLLLLVWLCPFLGYKLLEAPKEVEVPIFTLLQKTVYGSISFNSQILYDHNQGDGWKGTAILQNAMSF